MENDDVIWNKDCGIKYVMFLEDNKKAVTPKCRLNLLLEWTTQT